MFQPARLKLPHLVPPDIGSPHARSSCRPRRARFVDHHDSAVADSARNSSDLRALTPSKLPAGLSRRGSDKKSCNSYAGGCFVPVTGLGLANTICVLFRSTGANSAVRCSRKSRRCASRLTKGYQT
jgi:hypothetical protein